MPAELAAQFPKLIFVGVFQACVRDYRVGKTGITQLHIGTVIVDAVHFHAGVQLHDGGVVETDLVEPLTDALAGDDTCRGFHHLSFAGQAVFVAVPADAPRTVAAHFAKRAIGVKKEHFVVAALGGGIYHHQTVRADGKVPLAKGLGDAGQDFRRQAFGQIVQNQKIITGTVHLPKLHVYPSALNG